MSIRNEDQSLVVRDIKWRENIPNLIAFHPCFEKELDDDESTTYHSKLRTRLIIVHMYIRHILTTITFKHDYTNKYKNYC